MSPVHLRGLVPVCKRGFSLVDLLSRPVGHRRCSPAAGRGPLRPGQAEEARAGVPGGPAAQDLPQGAFLPPAEPPDPGEPPHQNVLPVLLHPNTGAPPEIPSLLRGPSCASWGPRGWARPAWGAPSPGPSGGSSTASLWEASVISPTSEDTGNAGGGGESEGGSSHTGSVGGVKPEFT